MRHKWDEGETLLGLIFSTCKVCGGVRTRNRYAGTDFVNTGGISIDMVGRSRKGWKYDDTPRSCPGSRRMTDDDVFMLVEAELARARAKYPNWPTDIVHAASIASEESGEVVKACNSYKWQQGNDTLADIRTEAVQAIAMFVRLCVDTECMAQEAS